MALRDHVGIDREAPIPLATQLSEQIARLIASGQIPAGERLPAIRQLAGHLQINLHTVRAAYRQLESGGLITLRKGARAVVLAPDRTLLAARAPDIPTFTIGVLVPNYSPYYAPFLEGLEEATQEDPRLLFVCDTHYYTRHVSRYMDQLLAQNVDGIVVTHFEKAHVPELRRLLAPSRRLPPIVFADSTGMKGPSVAFDREGGGYELATHFIGHGHHLIGLVTPPLDWGGMAEVHRGYQRALATADITADPQLIAIVDDFSLQAGAQAANQLMGLGQTPTAILAAGDMLAIGAMKFLRDHGRRIPDDVAVGGFGEIELSAWVDPPLTTICLPARTMGHEAMMMLSQLILRKRAKPADIRLKTELVIRQSCGCPAQP